ncbi:hypothetical protein PG993_014069 [Apiospora rasikravindrae]|uniref:Heterokaryon incompatibility domain-containing protein n=1 Tax=Apiospora rasikravindrae TaxID=990691 RepID=A0ABR1RS04_9PEZI
MGFAERFVWLDVFCIPQDRANVRLAPVAQIELARQAEIFRNATTAVIWFTDVDNWKDAEANIAWLALTYLRDGVRRHHVGVKYKIACAIDGLRGPASLSSGFRPRGTDHNNVSHVPGWMSSLWTLQEAVIRPNMILINRNLEPLLVGSNTAVTFDILVALFSCAYYDSDWRDKCTGEHDSSDKDKYVLPDELWMDSLDGDVEELDAPQGVIDLAGVLLDTGSIDLIEADQLTPLVLGTKRQATASRGEAIMAVTGAVGWHLGRSVTQFQNAGDATQDSLFGLYPFEFVHELRERCGAVFFTYQQEVSTLILTRNGFIDPGFRGTMLPFMKDSPCGYNVLASDNIGDRSFTDHPSVESWILKRDGSVEISQAAIVAGSNDHVTAGAGGLATTVIADISHNDPHPSGIRQPINVKGDLVDVIQSLKKEAVAICTMYSESQIVGIIL